MLVVLSAPLSSAPPFLVGLRLLLRGDRFRGIGIRLLLPPSPGPDLHDDTTPLIRLLLRLGESGGKARELRFPFRLGLGLVPLGVQSGFDGEVERIVPDPILGLQPPGMAQAESQVPKLVARNPPPVVPLPPCHQIRHIHLLGHTPDPAFGGSAPEPIPVHDDPFRPDTRAFLTGHDCPFTISVCTKNGRKAIFWL
ncbi:MAG: hypothetical protein HW383_836 [Candidatus Magasanikbacteria bacterium]|nr:hypothetical protein [Candidatus Magasanikbacteria bacterium]